jgi:hypothetical protein
MIRTWPWKPEKLRAMILLFKVIGRELPERLRVVKVGAVVGVIRKKFLVPGSWFGVRG